MPSGVSFVPVDFEADSLAMCLIQSGFDPSRAALFSWLAVTMYLTRAVIGQTLAEISGLAAGTELIADYMLLAPLRDADGNTFVELIMPVAVEHGEPWLTLLTPQDMSALLAEHGFGQAEHVRQRDQINPELWNRSDSLHPIDLSVVVRATVGGHDR